MQYTMFKLTENTQYALARIHDHVCPGACFPHPSIQGDENDIMLFKEF